MNTPTAVILAGGASSRLFPFNDTHKGYLTLHGKSLIGRTIDSLLAVGIEKIVVVIRNDDPDATQLKTLLAADGITHPIQYAIQPHQDGQGNAVLAAAQLIEGDFLVVSPYYVNAGELAQKVITEKENTGADCVFLGTPTHTPHLFGILEADGNRVKRVIEKPSASETPSNIRILSFYLFDHDFLAKLAQTPPSEYSLETAYSDYAQSKHVVWTELTDPVLTLKYPWHLFDFQQHLLQTQSAMIDSTAIIDSTVVLDDSQGPIVIEAEAVIGHAVKIVGPAYIGTKAKVGDFSLIRASSLEKEVLVGAHSEIARSIMMEQSSVHRGYIGDSIIGKQVRLGAGFVTANKRFDRQSIPVEVKGERVDSQLKNLGVMIGTKTAVGVQAATMPGTLVGPDQTILPLTVTKGTIK